MKQKGSAKKFKEDLTNTSVSSPGAFVRHKLMGYKLITHMYRYLYINTQHLNKVNTTYNTGSKKAKFFYFIKRPCLNQAETINKGNSTVGIRIPDSKWFKVVRLFNGSVFKGPITGLFVR